LEEDAGTPAGRTIQSLVRMQLMDILSELIATNKKTKGIDAYTRAHLTDSEMKISKALNAQFTIGGDSGGGGTFDLSSLFGQ
jgi:hypothetical protein